MTAKEIGKLLRAARKGRGWSQRQLGDKAGYRQATVSALERGRYGARLHTVLDIVDALDLRIVIADKNADDSDQRSEAVDKALAQLVISLLRS